MKGHWVMSLRGIPYWVGVDGSIQPAHHSLSISVTPTLPVGGLPVMRANRIKQEFTTSAIASIIPVDMIPTLIDLALQTGDKKWFTKLSKKYANAIHYNKEYVTIV